MTEPNRGPAWLVLPTYNEAENIEPFVAAVRANLPADARILIVDDGSPDGTGERADRLAERHPNVSVLHRREKEGLGPAYIAGFRRALASGAGLVLEMDSDFSHDPAYLPRLLDAARRRRPGDRLALRRRAAGSATGASCGGRSAAAAASTRGSSSGSRSTT